MPRAESARNTASRVVGAAMVFGGLGALAYEVVRGRGGDRTGRYLLSVLVAVKGADLVHPKRQPTPAERARRRDARE